MDSTAERPKVGVGVIVLRDGKVLLGRRRGSHGSGTWCFPGGHLEFGEEVFDCATRELQEETGLTISEFKIGPWTNDIFTSEGRHYITVFVIANSPSGVPARCEPEKCDEWRWCSWGSLPQPLFVPIQNLLKRGYSPFEEQGGCR